jgi:hypothetical protein
MRRYRIAPIVMMLVALGSTGALAQPAPLGLYDTWQATHRSDPAQAYRAAKEYLGVYPSGSHARELSDWVGAYEAGRQPGAAASPTAPLPPAPAPREKSPLEQAGEAITAIMLAYRGESDTPVERDGREYHVRMRERVVQAAFGGCTLQWQVASEVVSSTVPDGRFRGALHDFAVDLADAAVRLDRREPRLWLSPRGKRDLPVKAYDNDGTFDRPVQGKMFDLRNDAEVSIATNTADEARDLAARLRGYAAACRGG